MHTPWSEVLENYPEALERNIEKIQRRILEREMSRNSRNGRSRKRDCRTSTVSGTKTKNKDIPYSRTLTVHIIDTVKDTDKILDKLKYTSCVGFDCEGIYTLGREGKLSLLQLCDDKNVYLIDMVALKQKIPKSLSKWLASNQCCKFIHDSRQDQDALYHCHGIELGGIFDTTIADMVHRVHNMKQSNVNRLRGMASLAKSIIKFEDRYKVIFAVETNRTGKPIDLKDLQKESKLRSDDDAKWGDPDAIIGYTNGKRDQYKVNCFAQKEDTKAMMMEDNCLWARRPLPLNILLYAAVDGWLSFEMGRYYRKKFQQWQIDKTMYVSLRWCRMTASKTETRRGSARVDSGIVKLIRSNTRQLDMDRITHLGAKKAKYKDKKYTETVDIDLDNLLLMTHSHEFVVQSLEASGKMSKFKKAPEVPRMMQKHVSDIHTFKYDKDEDYMDVGKLVYNRLVPLRLIDAM